ncbi:hypothetical protein DPEC_G00118330 [Dallia pectoralis]|uniref:Uncharacterized protein n=1 Tax=Dallia pectoralis TaxID=75939 RepID=A0ACC2GV79_DALPE|nr:hypothetical protein DPEC_G00118330 [Dallia pectoralis]
MSSSPSSFQQEQLAPPRQSQSSLKPNQVGQVVLYGVPIVSLVIDLQERLCLAQISNTLLKNYSYNEIHNRRVALGITCVQCTPVQLEILRRAGAMPISSRRCGMITKREAERLCKSFLGENNPPKLPDNFAFDVSHECAWGSRGNFIPARYNSSRAKCIKCSYCNMYFSPNKFIFHSHRTPDAKYTQPDAANFNSWRRHLKLSDKSPPDDLAFAWEDVKAMFNGGSRKRALPSSHCSPMGPGKDSVLPHMMTSDLGQKRSRYEEDEDLDGSSLSPHKNARSYPVIPVPSKGFGMLQKFPPTSLFSSPYSFPAFSLCQQKKDDSETAGGQKNGGLSGLLWPGRKDTFYPPFCMFWPPRASGGLPVPTYLQPQPSVNALSSLTESPSLRQAFLDLSEPADPGSGMGGTPRSGLFDTDSSTLTSDRHPVTSEGWLKLLDAPSLQARKASYHSAFRPVVKDAEIIAKLHGNLEEFGSERHLSPATSCSYVSESGEGEGGESEEEGEVDVETKQDEEDSFSKSTIQTHNNVHLRGLSEGSRPKDRASGGKERLAFPCSPADHSPIQNHSSLAASPPALPASLALPSPSHNPLPLEDQAYKNTHKSRDDGLPVYATKNNSNLTDENKEASSFVSETESFGTECWRETLGNQTPDETSPVALKKDVENMEKEELQKVLLEQIDLRRRLEQEFNALKGNSSFPVFHSICKYNAKRKDHIASQQKLNRNVEAFPVTSENQPEFL